MYYNQDAPSPQGRAPGILVGRWNMPNKPVPLGKLSKKDRRALDAKKRVTWAFTPVSRVKQSKKVYKRARNKHRADD